MGNKWSLFKEIYLNLKAVGIIDITFIIFYSTTTYSSTAIFTLLSNQFIIGLEKEDLNEVFLICIFQIIFWIGTICISSYEQNIRQKTNSISDCFFQLKIRDKILKLPMSYLNSSDHKNTYVFCCENADSFWGLFRSSLSIIICVCVFVISCFTLINKDFIVILFVSIVAVTKFLTYKKCSDIEYLTVVSGLEAERKKRYIRGLLYNNTLNKEIRSFNALRWMIKKYDDNSKLCFEKVGEANRINTKRHLLSLLVIIITDVVCRIYLFFLFLYTECNVAELVLLFGMWEVVVQLTDHIFSDYAQIRHDYKNCVKICNFFCEKEKYEVDVKTSVESIELANVKFSYGNKSSGFELNVDKLRFEKGNVYLLFGENGAGKSTLIKLILGYFDNFSGEIKINDEVSKGLVGKCMIGYISQDDPHIEMSIEEIVLFGSEYERNRLWDILKKVGLKEWVEKLPEQEKTVIGSKYGSGINASGGQWQRLSIARLLYNSSDVIILDEPTANLDPMAERELFLNIKMLFPEKVVIIISHRLSCRMYVDSILFMEEGAIIGSGSHKELFECCDKYRGFIETEGKIMGRINET